jgi:hypothetical protein
VKDENVSGVRKGIAQGLPRHLPVDDDTPAHLQLLLHQVRRRIDQKETPDDAAPPASASAANETQNHRAPPPVAGSHLAFRLLNRLRRFLRRQP